jgi:hypothetical protein
MSRQNDVPQRPASDPLPGDHAKRTTHRRDFLKAIPRSDDRPQQGRRADNVGNTRWT